MTMEYPCILTLTVHCSFCSAIHEEKTRVFPFRDIEIPKRPPHEWSMNIVDGVFVWSCGRHEIITTVSDLPSDEKMKEDLRLAGWTHAKRGTQEFWQDSDGLDWYMSLAGVWITLRNAERSRELLK